jgi:pimeloyl-ACP methyl ester carboxylesterase
VSGGGPFALAAAAVIGDRASSVTIASGTGPPSCGLGALTVIRDMTEAEVRSWARAHIATEPLAPTGIEMLDLFLTSQAEGMRGPDGIVEDVLTLREQWTIEFAAVTAPVTLFHAVDDESCPIEGARFLAGCCHESSSSSGRTEDTSRQPRMSQRCSAACSREPAHLLDPRPRTRS